MKNILMPVADKILLRKRALTGICQFSIKQAVYNDRMTTGENLIGDLFRQLTEGQAEVFGVKRSLSLCIVIRCDSGD
ncbi:hypothetical protein QUF90_07985 [Desulfococcaceae bacterium HSG9]|nr:hypothetical protein [Desulfococcaceae bacterium HSG9]